jgi:hypothetical protein
MDNYDKHARGISNHTCESGLISPIMNEITQPQGFITKQGFNITLSFALCFQL